MVYMVTDGSGFVKIGVSKQLKTRLVTMQTGNPRRLIVLFTFETDTLKQDKLLEKAFHAEFSQQRLIFEDGFESEWFEDRILENMNNDADFCDYICDKYGFTKIIAHSGTSYCDVEKRRNDKLKSVTTSIDIYAKPKPEEQIVPKAKSKKAERVPIFKPGDVVMTRRTMVDGRMYSGFMYSCEMGAWRAIVCSVHEWEYGFYYMLDNETAYAEEMLEVYQPWKKAASW